MGVLLIDGLGVVLYLAFAMALPRKVLPWWCPLHGFVVVAGGGLLALYGMLRLGIGRHGETWDAAFHNPLTASHVENLATLASGLIWIAFGGWLAVTQLARKRACG